MSDLNRHLTMHGRIVDLEWWRARPQQLLRFTFGLDRRIRFSLLRYDEMCGLSDQKVRSLDAFRRSVYYLIAMHI